MNKKFKYLFIFVLLVSFSKDAFAGTDVLCNVLTTINITLKEVGAVQSKISGKVRKILSTKVSPEGLLGYVGVSKSFGDPEKMRERAENLKEKADKVKEFAENAKEKKEELMAQYKELNDLSAAQFAQANEAFQKGKALYAEYENKYIELRNDVEKGVADGKEAIQAGKEAVDMMKNPNNVGVTTSETEVKDSLEIKNMLSITKNNQNNVQITPVNRVETNVSKLKMPEVSKVSMGMQAGAISSASRLADKVITENKVAIEPVNLNVLDENKVDISAEDIMKGVLELKQQPEVDKDIIKTDISLKDQLTKGINKPIITPDMQKLNNAVLSEKAEAEDISEKAKAGIEKADVEKVKALSEKAKAVSEEVKASVIKKSIKENKAEVAKKISISTLNKSPSINSSVLPNKIETKETVNAKQ